MNTKKITSNYCSTYSRPPTAGIAKIGCFFCKDFATEQLSEKHGLPVAFFQSSLLSMLFYLFCVCSSSRPSLKLRLQPSAMVHCFSGCKSNCFIYTDRTEDFSFESFTQST